LRGGAGLAVQRLSIIIPALNEAASIGAALTRLQAARRRGQEVIVVDGGSVDGTPAQCDGLVDQLLCSETGRATQMNAGAARAHGDTLLFLHADTLAPDDIDQLIAAALCRAPGWGRFDVRLSGSQPLLRLVEWLMNLRSRISGIATGDQGLFVTRAWFDTLGGFPDLPLMEDIALSTRLKRRARPHCLRARLLTSSRRWERHGIARTVMKMWWLRAAFFLGVPASRLVRQYD
jgi:rSAM/selenodomain-associated transferase 2